MANRRSTSERTGQKSRQKGKGSVRQRKNVFGNFCLVLQALVSLAFMGVVILLDMLPLKYLGLVAMVLFFLWCITFVSQAARKKKRDRREIVQPSYDCFTCCGNLLCCQDK